MAIQSGVVVAVHGGQTVAFAVDASAAEVPDSHLAGNALWRELHTQADPTPEWFDAWCNRVRLLLYACGCSDWLAEWLAHPCNRPDYSNFFPFSVKLHNAVNVKLNPSGELRPHLSVSDARAIWLSE